MMQISLVMMSALFIAPVSSKPVDIERTIKWANKVAASATATWTRFDPASDAYATAIETIKRSGVFEYPVEMSVSHVSIRVDPQTHAMTLEGIYKGVEHDLDGYFTRDEFQPIAEFDATTETLEKHFRQAMESQRDQREIAIDKRYFGPGPGRQFAYTQLEKWAARKEADHKARMKTREAKRLKLLTNLGAHARERKGNLEPVRIKATIASELASTIDMSMLKTSKTVGLTMQVQAFDLRKGDDEIDYPVTIESLSGEAVAIVMKK